MNRKAKGTNAERELLHKFWSTGEWVVMRAPGSGSIKYPCPDLLAGNLLRKLAIECKASGHLKKYITKKQVEELQKFSRIFGAEPWIGVRFDNHEWYFLSIDDLEQTDQNYLVSLDLAKRKGFLFEELIEKS